MHFFWSYRKKHKLLLEEVVCPCALKKEKYEAHTHTHKQTSWDSLPASAERFVRGANGQGERFSFSEHLTGDVEVRAVLLVEAREPQHRGFQQGFVALLLSLSF